jgi:hypothetical protein
LFEDWQGLTQEKESMMKALKRGAKSVNRRLSEGGNTMRIEMMKATRALRLSALCLVLAVSTASMAACGGQGDSVSQSFEGDGFSLEIADATAFAADGSYETFIGDTHMSGGSTLWAGSSLPGNVLTSAIEYNNNLMIIIKSAGTVSDVEALASGATLEIKGDPLSPVLAWASTDSIVLFFDAPSDENAKAAFANPGGDSLKLVLQ